jgi:hypothetical protein
MENQELDTLRTTYKAAVEQWVAAIREEEALATPDQSMVADEAWDQAHFKEEDARNKAKRARNDYKDALRRVLYNF